MNIDQSDGDISAANIHFANANDSEDSSPSSETGSDDKIIPKIDFSTAENSLDSDIEL